MKSQAITILSIVGVLGTGVAAMAVNSDVLSSSVQAPIGQSSEAVLVTPSADPSATALPDPAATGVAVPTDLPEAGGSDDGAAGPGSIQPSPVSTGSGTRSESGAESGAEKSSGSDDAPRPAPVPVVPAPAPAPAPAPVTPAVTPAPTTAPHVEDDDSKVPSTGENNEKDD
ncbi:MULTISPECIES: hypothetical protein [unclassified Cryobacterium]|uniref:hypothetical protein n=1 Tax=unclassified Cryobacterium TaxID=2649013 RepID=UPI002AB43876|nr:MULTISPECIES: hypothetical protein [unclassified Cryobacterium]MDY7542547.1 hypothetical protein [Cryobacterium sp. 5B3]MEB0267337.1 hypothetical protein [Cryobacterium sp. 10I5]MEB0275174.1 hypothetical protein [Cryobacterium sp. 5B3]